MVINNVCTCITDIKLNIKLVFTCCEVDRQRCISVCMNEAGDEVCEMYAGQGDCVNNADWMFRNCWKSCVQCQAQTGQFRSLLCA